MYKRKSNTDHIVVWDPEDSELAEEAAIEITGDVGAIVDRSTAREIREKYRELHVEEYGEDSRYYDGSGQS